MPKAKDKPGKTPKPKSKPAKNNVDWKDVIKKIVRKKYPFAGWPED
jgi:hypothetical protein